MWRWCNDALENVNWLAYQQRFHDIGNRFLLEEFWQIINYCVAPNFCGKFCDFHELLFDHKILFTKISSQNAWFVDEEVSVLGTNNSWNLTRFTKLLSWKCNFRQNSMNHENFQTMEIWSYMVLLFSYEINIKSGWIWGNILQYCIKRVEVKLWV